MSGPADPLEELFSAMYAVRDDDRRPFSGHWTFGGSRLSRDMQQVAFYETAQIGDGQSAVVRCAAMPARFYEIEVLPGYDSIARPKAGYIVRTGSGNGMAELAARLADAISDGMIDFEP